MYKVIDIANYTINFSIENNKDITNLKLQKLLYYIEAAFLVNNKNCFIEDIKHWRHGPVVPSIYSKFRIYCNESIKTLQKKPEILDEDKELINKVIISNFEISPWDMVEKTHQEAPWKNTNANETIEKETIKNYFNCEENRKRIFGDIS